MSLADELHKLDQLYRNGTLTEAEFAQAKASLLNAVPAAAEASPHFAEQLDEVRLQNELTRLDREWELERQQFMITTRYGRQIVPTVPMGTGTAVAGGLFGVFWLVMAINITSAFPDEMPFSMVRYVFPVAGLAAIGFTVWWGIHCVNKAKQYQSAWQNYQERRQRFLNRRTSKT